jgi:ABC-type lipoprotein release transport system permease subunit
VTAGLILKLAWRNIWRNQRRAGITLASIAVALTFAIAFKSLGAGLNQRAIERATTTSSGHMSIEDARRLDASSAWRSVDVRMIRDAVAGVAGIRRLRPQTLAQGIASASGRSIGVSLTGIEPASEEGILPMAANIVDGRFLRDSEEEGVLVGSKLAAQCGIRIGESLAFTTTLASGEVASARLPVVGVFRVDDDDVDGYVLLASIGAVRRILGLGTDRATVVGVQLSDPDAQEDVRARLRSALGAQPVAVRTWQETMPEVAAMVATDHASKGLLASTMLLLVAFTILNTILMSVVERLREFAVSLALGTDPWLLRLQLLAEAAVLAAIGTAAGLSLGTALSLWAGARGVDLTVLFPGDVSAGLHVIVYPRLTVTNAVDTSAFVFLLTLGTALYPMFRSTHVRVAGVLQTRRG